ncbi:MAG: hypothetical protein JW884_12635 [Deltaproteobacteria bacterium]|nr:hypothetical protein [Deltaproteobacteria bacterium]
MTHSRKYAGCIQKPYDSSSEEHRAHKTVQGTAAAMRRWTFCGDGHLPESSIRVTMRHLQEIPPDYKPHVETHYHDADKLYILLPDGDSNLEARVVLDGEEYTVLSPVTIFIPKGLPHSYRPLKGRGILLMILNVPCSEHYNNHTFSVA